MGNALTDLARRVPGLPDKGLALARSIHQAVLAGGPPARRVADLLHGTWLGHPLHAVLTDFTVGSWSAGAVYDAVGLATGNEFARQAGTSLAALGTASAIPTALTGLTDYSTVPKSAAGTATLHATANSIGLTLYLLSLAQRGRGRYRSGAYLSFAAIGAAGLGAYLGGHLTYRHGVGADHSQDFEGWTDWKRAIAADALPEGRLKRVDVEGWGVLLYREDGAIHAIDAVCAHAGGPLEEGEVRDCTVRCPWHDSVFSLRDGRVVHGPSVHDQQAFEVREREGQVEVRPARRSTAQAG
jgi:nitrite reductase/ring-hydroxylating ferredoxin subunit/uncharacterized membrane protein